MGTRLLSLAKFAALGTGVGRAKSQQWLPGRHLAKLDPQTR
jgi:hypothetical protein